MRRISVHGSGVGTYPRVHPKTAAEWRRWLRDNHDEAQGVWLVAYKAATGKARLSYEESIPDALCYGWIDSVNKPLDQEHTALLFTPRKAGSGWSRTNKVRIARLLKEGRMEAPGLAKIAAAKRDGSWTLLDGVEALEVPDDLQKALGTAGTRKFEALTPGRRKEHLRALVTAKRPETRAKRVADIVRVMRACATT
ncbi:MAG: YdeI/OmpD-associated family protein [Chloroflexota bacterium]|nr:YdeI/OmpD-associated family protein [Chloroflexota bacterium]